MDDREGHLSKLQYVTKVTVPIKSFGRTESKKAPVDTEIVSTV